MVTLQGSTFQENMVANVTILDVNGTVINNTLSEVCDSASTTEKWCTVDLSDWAPDGQLGHLMAGSVRIQASNAELDTEVDDVFSPPSLPPSPPPPDVELGSGSGEDGSGFEGAFEFPPSPPPPAPPPPNPPPPQKFKSWLLSDESVSAYLTLRPPRPLDPPRPLCYARHTCGPRCAHRTGERDAVHPADSE